MPGHRDSGLASSQVKGVRSYIWPCSTSDIQSGVLLATIHVRAGEPRGLALAHSAVTAASKLTSIRTRKRLEPLYVALEARSGSDAEQLARMARHVAVTRA